MHSAINISLESCTFYLNTALFYAYKNFCKLQSSVREILTCYKEKKTSSSMYDQHEPGLTHSVVK